MCLLYLTYIWSVHVFNLKGIFNEIVCAYLRQLHHHVGKDMKEPNNSIPQPAVGQGLLVASAWTLRGETEFKTQQTNKKNC